MAAVTMLIGAGHRLHAAVDVGGTDGSLTLRASGVDPVTGRRPAPVFDIRFTIAAPYSRDGAAAAVAVIGEQLASAYLAGTPAAWLDAALAPALARAGFAPAPRSPSADFAALGTGIAAGFAAGIGSLAAPFAAAVQTIAAGFQPLADALAVRSPATAAVRIQVDLQAFADRGAAAGAAAGARRVTR